VAPQYFDIKREPRAGIVFCAAKIIKLKNISGLIRAFAGLLKVMPEAELRLAGSLEDQSYVQHCHALAGSLQISNRVRFLGTLNILQVQRELAQADCLALCSFQESAPVAIGEAMAAGVPVLAANVGGVAFMVEEGVTGRLVNPHADAEIKQALVKLLMQDNLSAMGAAAKTKALAEFHSATVARKTLTAYSALCN
jgi:glycosyltransferase involved in cell wall biosynthesis